MTMKLSVSLPPESIRIVKNHGRRVGVKSFSGALQVVIHEFNKTQKAAAPVAEPAQPTPDAAQPATAG